MLNQEQDGKLKKNLIRDSKDTKNTVVALFTKSLPSASPSTLTITELEPSNSKDLPNNDLSEFDESLALLTNSFWRFARESNLKCNKPLTITEKRW